MRKKGRDDMIIYMGSGVGWGGEGVGVYEGSVQKLHEKIWYHGH